MLLLPTNPGLSSVQVLASTNFAPVAFVFPTDGRDKASVSLNLQYAWKEVRRWHRSFSILCDEAEDEDFLHLFHLLFSCLFILLDDPTSDAIDKGTRLALQPLREWAGTVVRTREEYMDFGTNVRVSLLTIYRVIHEVGILHLSSKQAAEITTSMDEVAIFLKLKKVESSVQEKEDLPERYQHHASQAPNHGGKKRSGMLGKLRKMFGRRSSRIVKNS